MKGGSILVITLIFGSLVLILETPHIIDNWNSKPELNEIVLCPGESYDGFTFNGVQHNYASLDQAIITIEDQTNLYQVCDTFTVNSTTYEIEFVPLKDNFVKIKITKEETK